MNDLDFQNRTRTFFSEIRRKYSNKEETGPIKNKQGTLSDNVNDTLKNWTEFYKDLYCDSFLPNKLPIFPTPDEDPILDQDLMLSEFVDIVYSLRNHKSPGFDNILNEDITSVILEEEMEDEMEDPIPRNQNIALLDCIFKIICLVYLNYLSS